MLYMVWSGRYLLVWIGVEVIYMVGIEVYVIHGLDKGGGYLHGWDRSICYTWFG